LDPFWNLKEAEIVISSNFRRKCSSHSGSEKKKSDGRYDSWARAVLLAQILPAALQRFALTLHAA
jgi:hypothetical protein